MKIVPSAKALFHGGDYNPDQWPREVWEEDMRIMTEASVNIATVGVFSWTELEPADGQFEFGWLDDVMDMLDRNGRVAALATPSAAQPAWMSKKYPEVLRTDSNRQRRKHGNRVNFCWTSPIYREKVAQISRELAARYGNHPALAFWHVSNEYGGECYCELCVTAFRAWLKRKFDNDLYRLNHAYWTRFWSHTFTSWEEIDAPGGPIGETAIHGLSLDWKRFVSDQIVDFFLSESAPLREISPNVPITTNLMGTYPGLNSWKIAPHLDFVSWDSYPGFTKGAVGVDALVKVGFIHDLNRTLKAGKPFLLIETTPSSSNWYPVMALKRPGMHRLEGLQAVAHGSDGVMYFQWRASRGSQEKFHGAVVMHDGGTDTQVFRSVAALGHDLAQLSTVLGSSVKPEVAVVFDWENQWSHEVAVGPRQQGKDYMQTVVSHYRPFWEAGVSVDVIDSTVDLSQYRVVIAPMLSMLRPGVAESIEKFVRNGGTFVTTYLSGLTDENDLCFLGGFPGPLRPVLGLWVEATDALFDGQKVASQCVDGNTLGLSTGFESTIFCDVVRPEGCEVIAEVASDFYSGSPSVTVHAYGDGEAFYIAGRNDGPFLSEFTQLLLRRVGIEPSIDAVLPSGVTVQIRENKNERFVFVINCNLTAESVILLDAENYTNWKGHPVENPLELDALDVVILRRSLR